MLGRVVGIMAAPPKRSGGQQGYPEGTGGGARCGAGWKKASSSTPLGNFRHHNGRAVAQGNRTANYPRRAGELGGREDIRIRHPNAQGEGAGGAALAKGERDG